MTAVVSTILIKLFPKLNRNTDNKLHQEYIVRGFIAKACSESCNECAFLLMYYDFGHGNYIVLIEFAIFVEEYEKDKKYSSISDSSVGLW